MSSANPGDEYSAGAYVNAAGPWANLISDMIGVEIPIKPLSHDLYVAKMPMEADVGTAYTTLPTETYWYREHKGNEHSDLRPHERLDFEFGFNYDVDVPFFEKAVWPDLAAHAEPGSAETDQLLALNAASTTASITLQSSDSTQIF